MLREGLRALLVGQPEFEIVGEAGDSVTAATMVRTLQPDIVILDINLGNSSGLELATRLIAEHPALKVLVLSGYDYPQYVRHAMQHGIMGYVLKGSSSQELIKAVQTVAQGQKYYDDSLNVSGYGAIPALTNRESKVLQLLAEGLPNKQIAEKLDVTTKTIETHISRLFLKLGAQNRTELILKSLELGFLGPGRI